MSSEKGVQLQSIITTPEAPSDDIYVVAALRVLSDAESISFSAFYRKIDDTDEVYFVIASDDGHVENVSAAIKFDEERCKSEVEYDGLVAIPSRELALFIWLHDSDEFHILVTNNFVRVRALKDELLLSKQMNECIIGGSFDDELELMVPLDLVKGGLNDALTQTKCLWLFTSTKSDTYLITFPFFPMGILSYFFDEANDREPVKSLVLGQPVLLALQDIDGTPSFLEKAFRFIEEHEDDEEEKYEEEDRDEDEVKLAHKNHSS
ncbi:hypothetical protein A4A49_08266 [Nicotiana attenuata]|uniref:Uncharacterized protein n=1 Tax=Nicotiana attenuata TaxID=49451 RepID=A0A1J6JBI7_NICAT|nr:hypothetical protein A4A49_08266 [Nicotiana attenuata]